MNLRLRAAVAKWIYPDNPQLKIKEKRANVTTRKFIFRRQLQLVFTTNLTAIQRTVTKFYCPKRYVLATLDLC
jgi:hypothetical protein